LVSIAEFLEFALLIQTRFSDLQEALEHFGVLIANSEVDLLFGKFQSPSKRFDFRAFVNVLFPAES